MKLSFLSFKKKYIMNKDILATCYAALIIYDSNMKMDSGKLKDIMKAAGMKPNPIICDKMAVLLTRDTVREIIKSLSVVKEEVKEERKDVIVEKIENPEEDEESDEDIEIGNIFDFFSEED